MWGGVRLRVLCGEVRDGVGWGPRWAERGWGRGEAEVGEDGADDVWVVDEGDDPARTAAVLTFEQIDAEAVRHQFRPGTIEISSARHTPPT